MKLIKGKNNDKILKDLRTHNEKVTNGIRKGLYEVGRDLTAYAKAEIMKKPKNGKTYYLRKRIANKNSKFISTGKVVAHKASAPGEAPANFTGTLKKSVKFKVRGWRQLEFGASAVSPEGAPYSRYLELGTSKMEPRPYLLSTINSQEKNVRTVLVKHIKAELGVK